ncbi:MAG: hypothetical protein Q8R28_11345 [Dehalococcoidia bacterium]|nr:hypothetical protein [Dehalococcoidia bacterium]
MIWFRACPRCNGELCLDKDRYGPYIFCLQCGWQKGLEDFKPAAQVVLQAGPRRQEEVPYGVAA